MDPLHNMPQLITAVGGLGTAAFGLVDSTKAFWGGINRVGFKRISKRVCLLMPGSSNATNALTQTEAVNTLRGNWYNGTPLADQKSIAKSLIKLNVRAENAVAVAKATNLNPEMFVEVIAKQSRSIGLTPDEGDLYARFDFVVTAMLDEVYQLADHAYVNAARALAFVFAVGLSLMGWQVLKHGTPSVDVGFWTAAIIGVVATPLAPIAKDLSSALSTAVNALQAVKK